MSCWTNLNLGSSWAILGPCGSKQSDRKTTERRQKYSLQFCLFSVAFSGPGWALVGLWLGLWLALVGSGWAHGVISELSWGHLEAKKATERRQKPDRNIVYNSDTFLSLFLALDGL